MDKEAPTSGNDHCKKPKRKGRGATTGIKAKRPNKGPKRIDFDKHGRPYGPWRREFVRDIGMIARNNIKITYEDWFKVPEGIKDSIWKDLKNEWNLTDDAMRQKVLSNVGKSLRLFRTNLTCSYITKTRQQKRAEPLDDPLSLYKGITPDDWKEFVRQRMDEKFKEKSRKAQESQKCNLHRHYMGRAGYMGKMEDWYEEELNDALANDLDAEPEATQKNVTKLLEDRGYLWVKGHTPSSKDLSSQTQELISEINYWEEMKRKGDFVPSGREDVLVKATGKFDRPGFTRGIGGCVGITSFFGKSNSPGVNRKLYTEDDFTSFKEEVTKHAMGKVESLVKQHVSQILKDQIQLKSSYDIEINKITDVSSSLPLESSTHATKLNDPFVELKDPVPCRLLAAGETEIVVAEGTVWPWVEGKLVHNSLLTCENAHVSIDNIIDGKALLPIPWDEHERVGEVVGSFAQWPKSLVLLGATEGDPKAKDKAQRIKPKDTDNSAKVRPSGGGGIKEVQLDAVMAKATKSKKGPLNKDELSRLDVHCQRLEDMICYACSGGYMLFTIEIEKMVYSYESPVKLMIMLDDIREMFRYEWLNISILQLWGSFLYDYGTQLGVTAKLVGFLCPDRLCTYMHSEVETERYLTDALKAQEKKRYVMGAFYEASHWMLVVFCLRDNIAYIFDSDKATKKTWQIKSCLSWAWKRYSFRAGIRDMSKKK